MSTSETEFASHPGVAAALAYPFFNAVFNRRSRRFSLGAAIAGGPTKYRSTRDPLPLDELEEALLIQAATGMSGMALGDMPALDADGRDICTNTLARFVGRTWPSPCASHDTELIFWNDEGTHVAKFKDITPSKVREWRVRDLCRADGRAGRPPAHDGPDGDLGRRDHRRTGRDATPVAAGPAIAGCPWMAAGHERLAASREGWIGAGRPASWAGYPIPRGGRSVAHLGGRRQTRVC